MGLPALYNVATAATYLGVDGSTVYRAIERGELRAARVGAKRVLRITETALLEFLGESAVAPPVPPTVEADPRAISAGGTGDRIVSNA